MALLDSFKLQKLTIQAYRSGKRRPSEELASFTVPFNPASFSMSHDTKLSSAKGIRPVGSAAQFVREEPAELKLDLVFDGTGVADLGISAVPGIGRVSGSLAPGPDVARTVSDFLLACRNPVPTTHESAYLRISWGKGPLGSFDCRLKKADISYTAFDRAGSPLRARVSAVFLQAVDPPKQLRQANLTSPDLSHSRTVRAGDTLPLLCQDVYGSPVHHVKVARANDLDSLRALTPGSTLLFPPLGDAT